MLMLKGVSKMAEFYDYSNFKRELYIRTNQNYHCLEIPDKYLEILDCFDGKKDGNISNIMADSIFRQVRSKAKELKQSSCEEIGKFLTKNYENCSYNEASADKVGNLTNMDSNSLSTTLILGNKNDPLMNEIQNNQELIDKLTLEYGAFSIYGSQKSTYRVDYKKQNGEEVRVHIKSENLDDFLKRLKELQDNENNQVILETINPYRNNDNYEGRVRRGHLNYLNMDEVIAELNNDNSEKPQGDITLDDFKSFQYTNTGNEEQTVMGEKIKAGETAILYFTKAEGYQLERFFVEQKHKELSRDNIKQIFFYEVNVANIQKSNQEDDTSSDNEFANMLQEVDVTQKADRSKKYVHYKNNRFEYNDLTGYNKWNYKDGYFYAGGLHK